jgi:hypothetical protein
LEKEDSTMGKLRCYLIGKVTIDAGLHNKKRDSIFRYAPIVTMLLLGCVNPFDDDDKDDEPHFIYECVDSQADYACINSDYYDYADHMGSGYVMEIIALGSRFDIDYGRERSSADDYNNTYYHGGNYSEGGVRVISASTGRVSSGTSFEAVTPGLTALIAVNESEEVIDHMYVSVEPVTDVHFYLDGDSPVGDTDGFELAEGESITIRGRTVGGATYLRGTPTYECQVAQDSAVHLGINCTNPGAIEITAESAGMTTLRIGTGEIVEEITVTVVPGSGDNGTDTGVDTETDTGTDTDTYQDSDTEPDDAGVDAGIDTEQDTGTDTDTHHGTDTGLSDAGIDAGVDTDMETDPPKDSDAPLDGGPEEVGASTQNLLEPVLWSHESF